MRKMPELCESAIYVAELKGIGKTLFEVLTDITTPCVIYRFTRVDMNHVDYDLEHSRRMGLGEEGPRSGRIKSEPFAINYATVNESYPRMVDPEHGRHFRIDPKEKTIFVIAKDLPNLFYDSRKASQGGRYLYKGTLLDALKEFQEHDYSFYEAEEVDFEIAIKMAIEREITPSECFIPTNEVTNLENLFSEPTPK